MAIWVKTFIGLSDVGEREDEGRKIVRVWVGHATKLRTLLSVN